MNLRVRLVVLAFAVVAVVIGAIVLTRGPGTAMVVPEPREPILPDLVTLPMFDFLVGTEEDSRVEQLRFSTTIANAGAGPLHVDARRDDGSDEDWRVVQWFTEPTGGNTGVVTDANLVFGGHGHEHWHLRFGAAYRLYPAESESEIASQTKAGYCFFDQIRLDPEIPGAPAERLFQVQSCGTKGSTAVELGMSVGWSDPYFWQLEDQSVEITGLADGRYRLTAFADPDGFLRESDETNNETWADIEIGTTDDGLRTVEVVDLAPNP